MENLEQKLQELESRLKKVEDALLPTNDSGAAKERSGNRLSINEFLNSLKIGDDVKRTLAVAYWLDTYDELGSFNSADLTSAFRVARLKLPLNINDKINLNVKNGHLAEEKKKRNGKKAWYVTNSGIQCVEVDLKKSKE